MQPLTLEQKGAASEALLAGLAQDIRAGKADADRVFVAWTGGKDSTLALALWRAVLEHHGLARARAMTIDTGCKFPEIIAFRDRLTREWDVDLHVIRPKVDLSDYPVAEDKERCCLELKVLPLKRALIELRVSHLISGIRRDEHPDRTNRPETEQRADPPHIRLNPLAAWTEMDVWSAITALNLPHCELYDQGYRSLGCTPCTHKNEGPDERSGRDQDKERILSTLTDLGYF